MRLSEKDRKVVAGVLDAVPALRDGFEPCLQALEEPLRVALQADTAGAYCFGWEAGRLRVAYASGAKLPAQVGRDFRAAMESAPLKWGVYDPTLPAPSQRNVPLVRRQVVREEEETWLDRKVLGPHGLTRLDQLRVLVCDGPRLLAWVGGYRHKPFGPREQRILGALVPALQRRLRLEQLVQEAPLMRAALEATLEAMNAPAFLIDAGGAVHHANTAGRVLLAHGRAAREALRRAARGDATAAQLLPIAAPGLPLHFLAILSPPRDETAHRIALARTRWSLTPRQAEVLALVAAGESNKTVASRLGCEVGTVEAHVTALLRKSDSESRTALVARLLALRVP